MRNYIKSLVINRQSFHLNYSVKAQHKQKGTWNIGCNVFQISNDDISSFVPNNDLGAYLTSMSKDCTWGDHIVLVALANALEKTIRVVTSHVGDCYEVVVEAENQQGAPILLGHLSENHYVSLEPETDKPTKTKGIPVDSTAINPSVISYTKSKLTMTGV